jgi:hypothetical protein
MNNNQLGRSCIAGFINCYCRRLSYRPSSTAAHSSGNREFPSFALPIFVSPVFLEQLTSMYVNHHGCGRRRAVNRDVARKGDLNNQFGVYTSLCCGEEIVIPAGAAFPACTQHRTLTTEWELVGDTSETDHTPGDRTRSVA